MRKQINAYEGTGQLELENSTRETVHYEIDEYQDVLSAASHDNPRATIGGIKSFTCSLARTRNAPFLSLSGKPVTLHLEDGRKLRLLISGTRGNTISVTVTGGFF